MQQGHPDTALALAKQASTFELTLHAPSGPPEPIKPAPEYYAETLARTGQKSLAASAFQQELTRTPNRTPSVAGLKATGVTSASVFNTSKPDHEAPHESHVH
jgi:hypothetical protein